MDYPIAKVKTAKGLALHGLFLQSVKKETVLINIHGTASNFFEEDLMQPLSDALLENNISLLSTNNSGSEVLKAYPESGAAVEIFEDCLGDIDAWVSFTLAKGYKNIILQGHSLGSEKAAYYMQKGRYRQKVKALILLGFSDSFGCQNQAEGKHSLLRKAEELADQGRGQEFIKYMWSKSAGVLPRKASSYLSFYRKNSESLKALPFHKHSLVGYRKISVPILAVIGDKKEYTAIPVEEAIKLLKKENRLTECRQIKDCNHDFEGKEKELAGLITNFISKLNL